MRIIRGKFGRRRFDVPTNITARPTTDFARENIFNVLENIIDFEGIDALDLFSGTGAISFELLSRECDKVTSVEKAATQYNFIRRVSEQLNCGSQHRVVRGDAIRYIETANHAYDFVFADPPYDFPDFAQIPEKILNSGLLKPGSVFVIEHSKKHDFSGLPHFSDHRAYGSVNFSIFVIPENEDTPEEKKAQA